MTTHDAFLELAASAIDFELVRDERDRLARHEAGCPACREAADATRSDARALGRIPVIPLSERRGDEILDAVLRPRTTLQPLRLVLVAALLTMLALGVLAVGAQFLRQPDQLVVVPPAPTVARTDGPPTSPTSPTSVPATTEPLDPVAATWTQIGSPLTAAEAVESWITTVVGFAGGYAATGTIGTLGPAAWFSPDGVDWIATPLARSVVNCPGWGPEGEDMVPDAEHRAIATNGAEIVISGEVGDYAGEPCGNVRPVAWYSADGRTWQRSEPFAATEPNDRAIAVWPTHDGWQAWSGAAIWESTDGLRWQRISDRPGLDIGAGAPDGTLLARATDPESEAFTGLLTSKDGREWTSIDAPDGCTGVQQIVAPARIGSDAWVVVDDMRLCTSRDLVTWSVAEMTEYVQGVTQTRYGAMAVGDACFGAGVTCDPDPRAWILTDADTWAPMEHPPIFFGRSIADGPAGVVMIGTARGESPTDIWRLDP